MKLLSVQEAAERLGVKVSTVRAWIFQGRLERVKLGRAVRLRSDYIEQLIRESTVPERSLTKESHGFRQGPLRR